MTAKDILNIVSDQLEYFEDEEVKADFLHFQISIPYSVKLSWDYTEAIHECWVVAKNNSSVIVYCETGFGPSFPWAIMPIDCDNLGTDSQWDAYLFEAFTSSKLFKNEINIIKMGPGERNKILRAKQSDQKKKQ